MMPGMEETISRRSAEKREHWNQLAEEWKATGLSRAAFARQRGLRPNHFAWWLRRLKEEEAKAFVEVTAAEGGAVEANAGGGVTVVVRGVEVRLSPGFDEETFDRALSLLEQRR